MTSPLRSAAEVARALGHKVIKAIKEWRESKPRQETFWLDDVILSGITQDRQSHYDELVRRLEQRKKRCGHLVEANYRETIDQALTIVKEVYQVKE